MKPNQTLYRVFHSLYYLGLAITVIGTLFVILKWSDARTIAGLGLVLASLGYALRFLFQPNKSKINIALTFLILIWGGVGFFKLKYNLSSPLLNAIIGISFILWIVLNVNVLVAYWVKLIKEKNYIVIWQLLAGFFIISWILFTRVWPVFMAQYLLYIGLTCILFGVISGLFFKKKHPEPMDLDQD